MSEKNVIKPLAAALGAAFVGSVAGTSIANAADNPFGMTELSSGYMVASSHEGKCGEGKCGGKAGKEGKCGEGKCGMGMKKMDTDGDGKVTKAEFMAAKEKKFSMRDKNGDGVLDSSEMGMMMKEGKCGEGKCGGKTEKEGKCGGAK